MSRSRSTAFKTPPITYDYEPLIAALARCREEVVRLQCECGHRTPLHDESQAVIMDVEALAKLQTGDAAERVIPFNKLHGSPRWPRWDFAAHTAVLPVHRSLKFD